MGGIFTWPVLLAFALGVLMSAMVKGWVSAAKGKVSDA
jgi:hypothetical protein